MEYEELLDVEQEVIQLGNLRVAVIRYLIALGARDDHAVEAVQGRDSEIMRAIVRDIREWAELRDIREWAELRLELGHGESESPRRRVKDDPQA